MNTQHLATLLGWLTVFCGLNTQELYFGLYAALIFTYALYAPIEEIFSKN